MKKNDLKILGLSYSQTQIGQYLLILTETNGPRKIPIIIKAVDAEFISLKISGIKSTRPQIQDILKTVVETLNATVHEVFIHSILEGTFYARIVLGTALEDYGIECSVSDAVNISLTFGCPISCSDQVIDTAGMYMNEDGTITDEQYEENITPSKKYVSVEALEKILKDALNEEDYEKAASLKERIDELKLNKK